MTKAKADQMATLTAPLVNETGRVPGFVSGLIIIVGGFFLIAVVWASLTGIKSFSTAPGTLSANGAVHGAVEAASGPTLSATRAAAASLFLRQKTLLAVLTGQAPEFGRVGEEYPEQAKVQKLRYSSRMAMIDNPQYDKAQQDLKLNEELGQVSAELADALGEIAAYEERVVQPNTGEERLIAEVQVNPADFAQVRVGAPTDLKIVAFDAGLFGVATGKVTSISTIMSRNGSGQPYYAAVISLEKTYLDHANNRHSLSPGMAVQVEILTGEKSLADILFEPISRTLSVAFTAR